MPADERCEGGSPADSWFGLTRIVLRRCLNCLPLSGRAHPIFVREYVLSVTASVAPARPMGNVGWVSDVVEGMSGESDNPWAPGAEHEPAPAVVDPAPTWTPIPRGSLEPNERRIHPLVFGTAVVMLLVVSAALVRALDTGEPDRPATEEAAATAAVVEPGEVGDDGANVERAASLIDALPGAGDYLMFFRSSDSLAMLDFRDGTSALMDWSVPNEADTVGFMYLASERGSWVVDPDDLSLALRLAPNAQIGVLSNPTRTAVLSESDGSTTVLGGFFDGRSVRILAAVPMGADAEVVQQLGVLISPVSGGSYLVQEGSPTRVSDGRIVAATADRYAEILCDDRLQCEGRLGSWHDDEAADLPLDVLTAPVVRISPDGRWILSGGGELWTIYDVGEATFTSAGGAVAPNGSVTWSPDSSFFVWIDARTLFAASPATPLDRVDLALEAVPLPGLTDSEIGFIAVADTE